MLPLLLGYILAVESGLMRKRFKHNHRFRFKLLTELFVFVSCLTLLLSCFVRWHFPCLGFHNNKSQTLLIRVILFQSSVLGATEAHPFRPVLGKRLLSIYTNCHDYFMLHHHTQVCDHLPLRSWGCSACGHCGYAGQCSTWWQRRPGRSRHRCSWKESRWLSTNTQSMDQISHNKQRLLSLWHTTTTPLVLTSRLTWPLSWYHTDPTEWKTHLQCHCLELIIFSFKAYSCVRLA